MSNDLKPVKRGNPLWEPRVGIVYREYGVWVRGDGMIGTRPDD